MALTVGTDTYIALADAETYFAARLYVSEWTSALSADKEAALKMACKAIDRQPLRGIRKLTTQTLQFPRAYQRDSNVSLPSNLTYQNAPLGTSWAIEQDVPQRVKDAQCEEALALLKYGNSNRRRLQEQGVKSFFLGRLSETYTPRRGITLLSPEAKEIMRPYLGGHRVR